LTKKYKNLLKKIRRAAQKKDVFFTKHSLLRMKQRKILRREVFSVLLKGEHEEAKDFFEEKFSDWNYSIRGKTVNDRELRVLSVLMKMTLLS